MFDRCLYFNTTALARQVEREWSLAFSAFDLTPAQAYMLRAVLNIPGSAPSELAVTLAISRPTATRALDALEAKCMVERRGSPRDGREVGIHPSDAAVSIKAALDEASNSVARSLKSRLGGQRYENAVAAVRDVRFALE